MSIATVLQGVSPFGPIFGKELRITARLKRTYALRVIYLALLFLVLLGVYSATNASRGYGGVAAQNQQRSELGQVFFAAFAVFIIYTMGLIGPVLTATAVSSERLHNTLSVLLMTPITAWQIVAGKLCSRLLIAITLIGLSLPVLALVRLLGGVELEQMALVISLALVAVISSASIALFFSTLLNRAYAVILLSFGTMFLLYAFIPFVIELAGAATRTSGQNQMSVFVFILAINPYASAVPAAVPSVFGRMGGSVPWRWCIGLHLAMSTLLVMSSASVLRRRARGDGSPRSAARALPPRIAAPPLPAPLPMPVAPASAAPSKRPAAGKARAHASTGRGVTDNPILWHELRRVLFPRRWQRITAIIICGLCLLAVYALLGANHGLGDSDSQGPWACVFNFVILVVTLVISATAIAQEKESDTWTLLLASPVSASAIVWGKAVGVMRRLVWPIVFIAGHFLFFACCGVISFGSAFIAVWTIVTFNMVWVATGVYFSLALGKVTTAVIANFVLALSAQLLAPAALTVVENADFSVRDPLRDASAQWLNLASVIIFGVSAVFFVASLLGAFVRKRGALGQLMAASLLFYVASIIFAAKLRYIDLGRGASWGAWPIAFYYLAQTGEQARETLLRMPNGADFRGAAAIGCILVAGTAMLGLAAIVLGLTTLKLNAIVGRARQTQRL